MVGARPDIEFHECGEPLSRLCASGHVAPEVFARGGPGTEKLPTRFYDVVVHSDPGKSGVYCEPCVLIAQHLARQSRSKR